MGAARADDRLRHLDGAARPDVDVEGHAPDGLADGLAAAATAPPVAPWDSRFGHAHAIVVERDGILAGAADPRCRVGSCAGG